MYTMCEHMEDVQNKEIQKIKLAYRSMLTYSLLHVNGQNMGYYCLLICCRLTLPNIYKQNPCFYEPSWVLFMITCGSRTNCKCCKLSNIHKWATEHMQGISELGRMDQVNHITSSPLKSCQKKLIIIEN